MTLAMQIVELLTNGWLLRVWSVRTMKISYSHYLYLCTYSPVKFLIFIKFRILFVTSFKDFCKQNFKIKE